MNRNRTLILRYTSRIYTVYAYILGVYEPILGYTRSSRLFQSNIAKSCSKRHHSVTLWSIRLVTCGLSSPLRHLAMDPADWALHHANLHVGWFFSNPHIWLCNSIPFDGNQASSSFIYSSSFYIIITQPPGGGHNFYFQSKDILHLTHNLLNRPSVPNHHTSFQLHLIRNLPLILSLVV